MPQGFRTKLKAAIAGAGSTLCVGIDPHVDQLPPFFARELTALGPGPFLTEMTAALIDASVGVAPAVKLQSAFYEAFGATGFGVLKAMLARAKAKGLVTILDAKRGDIASTMAAYGRMAFETMDADALTVTPYVGLDAIEPLVPWLSTDRGVYLVWITSNAGGGAIQDLKLAGGGTVATALLDLFMGEFQRRGIMEALGLVLGATRLAALPASEWPRLRNAALLMPGVGAQGGVVSPELTRLVQESGAALVPQSRALSAFSPEIQSWRDYCAVVESRVRTAAQELRI